MLIAEELRNDLRVIEAKRLLIAAVKAHQAKITGVCPPIPSLQQSYEDLLLTFAQFRGAKLWFPFLGSGIGKGTLVELADGSIKYDFIGGIGVHYWGHSHEDLIASSIDAALSDTIMQGNLQQNIDSVGLSALLVQASKLDHCFLTSSGAMANENALKIAFQKKFPAQRILAFERCFVGRTLAVSQITDKAAYREGLPSNVLVDYIPYFNVLHPEESTANAINALKKLLHRYPKEYAVMCFEFVQGEGGFHQGTSAFFKAIMSILKDNNIAIFADEVQTFGRLPELFAFQYYGLEEFIDIVTIGKLSQVCATLFRENYKPRPGLLSQTFTSSTSAIKASQVIIKNLIHGNYYGPQGKIQQINNYFTVHLERLSKKHPELIRGPFGIGCMIAFTPYDGEYLNVTDFVYRLFEAGVLSFIAGENPTRVRFLVPAGAVTNEDIDHVVNIIEKTLCKN
ncbi:MAG: aminotransferase class III-fold pyridoxal phosphate-dependent enzyme [Parachlamydiaceae bacterium]|nr:aminotransferase class III-fold pyridoxal phosphate-dependent enzyme [Parachlamydiaceae bacterium]